MCEHPALCHYEILKKYRPLTILLLECWQREYDKRPYCNFRFDRLEMETRLDRLYNEKKDFNTIIRYLRTHVLCSIRMVGVPVRSMLHGFMNGLKHLAHIELRLMYLPLRFFEMLESSIHAFHVRNLILEGTPLDTARIMCLQLILLHSKSLKYINVASCGVTQFNFIFLADGIHKSTSLVGFNCSRILGGTITLDTDKIAHTVSSLIMQNKLQEIEMQHCEFISQDAEVIAEFLAKKNSVLRQLNLSNNNIGPDGAHYLFKAIAASGSLTHLSISGCNLQTHGGIEISRYLSSSYRLIHLDARYNNIKPEAITMILLTMKKRCKLHKLLLWGNRYNLRTGKTLRRLLDSHVLPQENIDLTVTYDDTLPGYRVIPWRP